MTKRKSQKPQVVNDNLFVISRKSAGLHGPHGDLTLNN